MKPATCGCEVTVLLDRCACRICFIISGDDSLQLHFKQLVIRSLFSRSRHGASVSIRKNVFVLCSCVRVTCGFQSICSCFAAVALLAPHADTQTSVTVRRTPMAPHTRLLSNNNDSDLLEISGVRGASGRGRRLSPAVYRHNRDTTGRQNQAHVWRSEEKGRRGKKRH